MIDKTPIPSLDLNSTEAKIQMNNFWKYLDDLAESDPEEYKKFISAQMKKGIQTFGPKNQNESNIPQSIKTKQEFANIQTYKCLRFKPIQIIKEEENSSNKENDSIIYKEKATASDISEIPNIQFGPEFQSDAFSSKVIQNRKIYLNILHADDYYGPTDDQGNFLKGEQLLNENNWRYIPTEFRYCGKKNSFSGSRCDFYDVIINSTVINKIQKDKSLYKTILGYIVRKFIIFLNDKIVLYTNSVKIVEEKKYKNVNHKPETFKSKLGERSLAVEKIHQQQKQKQQQQQQQQRVKDDKIIIPGTNLSESRKELYKEEEAITPADKIIENNINSDNSKEKENAANSKPVVIEEVGGVNKQIIPIKKKILSQTQMEVKFFFDEFEYLKGLKEIDLQIGENGIIIHLDNPHYIIDKNYEPVEMKFNFKVDPDKCSAKYSKKEKVLTVIIERII